MLPGPGWDNTPLERFDKFAKQPVSAWHVSDGTLSDGSAPDGIASDLWKAELRKITSDAAVQQPTFKSTNTATSPLYRQPQMMRTGVAGGDLGPRFSSMN
jgi:hypothetical protein